jgi:GNAT superfamily N-acetyltransferase
VTFAPEGVVLRPAEDRDAVAATALMREADDAHVVSEAGWLSWRHRRTERERPLDLVAEADGRVVAIGYARLNIWTSTPGASWAAVRVTEAHRRRGIGSYVHDTLLGHLREVGAAKATSFVRWSEDGERWATARGWERLLGGPLIALDPRQVPEPTLPAGYRCLSMAELDSPEAIFGITRVAVLDEPSPVPMDDVRYEDWLADFRDPDLDHDASAVVVEGDQPVAFTYMKIVGERGQHGGTGTLPDYRGRGLATAAKRFALRAAAAKGVTRVTTSNAEENAAMRAINRKLGFQPIGRHVIFGRDL